MCLHIQTEFLQVAFRSMQRRLTLYPICSFTADALYIASERHTYPVMTVMLSAVLAALCTFCALYNSLAPRPLKSSVNIENNGIELTVFTDPDDPQGIESARELGEVTLSAVDRSLSTSDTFPLLTGDLNAVLLPVHVIYTM